MGDPFNSVYSSMPIDGKIPDGFNAVTISLNGGIGSDLNWSQAFKNAEDWIEKGFRIFWDLDLGLFSRLPFPLTHQTQCLTLKLALDHFHDQVWKTYRDVSLGVSLFRQNEDLSCTFMWEEALMDNFRDWLEGIQCQELRDFKETYLHRIFCRNVICEYLETLAGRYQEEIPLFLLLDLKDHGTQFQKIQLSSQTFFKGFQIALTEPSLSHQTWGWNSPGSTQGYIGKTAQPLIRLDHAKLGLLWPNSNFCHLQSIPEIDELLSFLEEKKIRFRIIPEEYLTLDWDQMDDLFVFPQFISKQGIRKLLGFKAAGGRVLRMGFAELPTIEDLDFQEWKKRL